MNERINHFIANLFIALLVVSLLAVATLPVVLAWWDSNLYWLLLYLTYPVALVAVAATLGAATSDKTKEEKRRNSNEYY